MKWSMFTRMLVAMVVLAVGGFMSSTVGTPTQTLSAQQRTRPCGNGTIEGDWGVSVSGTRVAGPGMTESFIGVALRTYDGRGGFPGFKSASSAASGTS